MARRKVEKRTYSIEAPAEVLDRFENLLLLAQRNAAVGHSGKVGMPLDGDGSERPFKVSGGKITEELRQRRKPQIEDVSNHGWSVELAADDSYFGYMFKVRDAG